ncbi:hypothetical protein CRG98_007666 [Punica granatum]|uniref:Integrase catalytic domain-containing protein n=1 Tax=Punica granatum TaxID=22663 RepID=A0A2I0KTY9_PUNGR|nr:hypothetical protein CRG98_007666 [Punica granatum]
MDPLPNANRAHSMAAHDETKRQIAQGRESNAENRGDSKLRGRPFCDYCGRNEHHRATCYQLHGHPSSEQANQRNSRGNFSMQSRSRGSRAQSSSSSVHPQQRGGVFGQIHSGGPYQSGPSQSRSAQYNHGQWRPNQSFNSSPDNYTAVQAHAKQPADLSKLAHLSEAQLQQLVSMVSRDDGEINRLSGENYVPITSKIDWIIDSRASRHMTGSLDNMFDVTPIDGPIIHVPNGATQATFMGKDRTSGSMIGVGELHGGVWLLRRVSSSIQKLRTMKADVRSDNGSEFMSRVIQDYFSDNGIIHHTSCTDTPQQNGRVERKHRHILNVARALMLQASLPIAFWGECISAVAHLINLTPSGVLSGKTPFELLFCKKIGLSTYSCFGCLCYAHHNPRVKDKFGPRSRKCIFIGYPFGKKGWRVYDLESHETFISRDMHFNEADFPFSREQPTESITTSICFLDTAGPAFQGENFGPTSPNLIQGASIRPIEPSPDEIPHGEPSLDG